MKPREQFCDFRRSRLFYRDSPNHAKQQERSWLVDMLNRQEMATIY